MQVYIQYWWFYKRWDLGLEKQVKGLISNESVGDSGGQTCLIVAFLFKCTHGGQHQPLRERPSCERYSSKKKQHLYINISSYCAVTTIKAVATGYWQQHVQLLEEAMSISTMQQFSSNMLQKQYLYMQLYLSGLHLIKQIILITKSIYTLLTAV